jgi:hypothetical protein
MALGGGTFQAMDKIIPGTYINVVSKSYTADASDRGTAAMGLTLDWGPDSTAFTVLASEVRAKALKIFGYSLEDDAMKDIREIFKHATKLIAYKLTSGGTKASNTYATAKYTGTRGNSLSIVVSKNVDDETKYDVVTRLGNNTVDTQTVSAATGLVDNSFVDFIKSSTLAVGTLALAGGTNGTVDGTAHQAALTAFESQSFNVLGLDSSDATTKDMYVAYTKRMRDEQGSKFQLVAYQDAADYEGVINLKNTVSDTGASASALVYWLTGAEAGCKVPGSLTNFKYDGEYTVTPTLSQAELELAITDGELAFHRDGDDIRVLMDVNSLTTYTTAKSNLFAKNETVRTVDGFATEVCSIANTKYIGLVPNNKDGRMSLWGEISALHKKYEQKGAVTGYDTADLTVEAGEGKGDVVVTDALTVVGTVEKLYVTMLIG